MTTAAIVSFRLGGYDGVSIEAAKWKDALETFGVGVRTVAGSGPVDVCVRELERGAGAPSEEALRHALDGVDVVVVENLLSLPLNPDAARVLSRVLRGRPAILRHHDLPWHRPAFALERPPPDDAAWAHVTNSRRNQRELARAGIDAIVLHNRFALDGWRADAMELVGGPVPRPVVLHPTRAIPRKDVAAALRFCESLGGTYWLTGPAEDGWEGALARILSSANTAVLHEPAAEIAAAYAASDAVVFTSTEEGFGNPVIESALARRPLAVRRYPVLVEDLEPFGFVWFTTGDAAPLRAFLRRPDQTVIDRNEGIAREHFGLDRLPGELRAVVERVL